jgi:MoaA/NifB/PqqE/SkfB family radical SAM enzyme
MRKLRPTERAVDARSISLFRLAEACNNDCPMCSNSGRPEAWFTKTEGLIARVGFLHAQGFRRVVLTGGEPTIHPGFWEVVAALRDQGMTWDVNTHGRSFADAAFAARAREEGLERAIVSLHSHEVATSCLIFGVKEAAHHETVHGIEHLLAEGIWLMLNCVVTTHNAPHLEAYLRWCVARFGTDYVMKLAFPSTTGKGGEWAGLGLRYSEVIDEVRAMREAASELGLRLVFESFPSCVLDDPHNRNVSRSGFGETHYLDDVSGDRVYPIDHIEAALSAYPESCQRCRAVTTCPGVSEGYLMRFGAAEFVPL